MLDQTPLPYRTVAGLAGVEHGTFASWRSRGRVPATEYDLRDVLCLAVTARLCAGTMLPEDAARIGWALKDDWSSYIVLSDAGDRLWLIVRMTSRGHEFVVAADATLPRSLLAGGVVLDLTRIAGEVLVSYRNHLAAQASAAGRVNRNGVLLIEAPPGPAPVPATTSMPRKGSPMIEERASQPIQHSVLADRPSHSGVMLQGGKLGLYIRGRGLSIALDQDQLRTLASHALAMADGMDERAEAAAVNASDELAALVAEGNADG